MNKEGQKKRVIIKIKRNCLMAVVRMKMKDEEKIRIV